MAVKIISNETEKKEFVKKKPFKKPPEFSRQKMKKLFLEALETYRAIVAPLPPSFFQSSRRNNEDGFEEVELKTSRKNSKQPFPKLGTAPRAKTIKELERRLSELRGKTLNYSTKLIKKGLQNRLKKKQKLEERRELKKQKQMMRAKGNQVKHSASSTSATSPRPSTSTGQDGSLIFNKFDFPDLENKKKNVTKDPKQILHQIEKSKKKLKSLEERGHADKVAKIKNQQTWERAMQQAEGVKVKDDVELLKKSIAKKKQIKKRSAKKWEERTKAIESKKEENQKKRKEHLDAKKKDKKQKKVKKSIKKGRVVL